MKRYVKSGPFDFLVQDDDAKTEAIDKVSEARKLLVEVMNLLSEADSYYSLADTHAAVYLYRASDGVKTAIDNIDESSIGRL